jgi:hypothetical protein
METTYFLMEKGRITALNADLSVKSSIKTAVKKVQTVCDRMSHQVLQSRW